MAAVRALGRLSSARLADGRARDVALLARAPDSRVAHTALVIETLGSASLRHLLRAGSLGALEGANTAAFAALGLGAPAGLAFSLLRRLRQVVWIGLGVIVLLLARARMRLAPEAPA